LAHVHAVGPALESEFWRIVHDERDPEISANRSHGPRRREANLIGEVFFSQLNDVDTSSKDLREKNRHVLARGDAKIQAARA
jgi:hypothetical protein